MSDLAARMLADAYAAQKQVRKHLVLELDFSERSLTLLDGAWGDLDFAWPGGRTGQGGEQLARLWGAYLGEVVRRVRGGEWDESAAADAAPRVRLLNGATAAPHDLLRRRLAGEETGSLAAWFAGLTSRDEGERMRDEGNPVAR